ncbi:MAG: hypothetical protein EOO65_00495 [Methanosarcinales archaeon]|nr:MAG: hypothetical protein EOO65_00495 [Methanosarcinales archaeon]
MRRALHTPQPTPPLPSLRSPRVLRLQPWHARAAALWVRRPCARVQRLRKGSVAICLDILKSKSWTPALNVKTMLLSIGALLAAPEPDDPQDAVVASQYKMKHAEWRATARYWTDAYAKPPPATPVGDSKVEELVAMGFSRGAASAALKATDGNVDRAVDFILSSS